jgi:hypothetical protein
MIINCKTLQNKSKVYYFAYAFIITQKKIKIFKKVIFIYRGNKNGGNY